MKVDRLLETYCTIDSGTKAEMLATVASFMKQRGAVFYDAQEYHNIEDLKVDLEAICKTKSERHVEELAL